MRIDKSRLIDFDKKIIIAGSRGFSDYQQFCHYINQYLKLIGVKDNNFVFITGEAYSGADALIIRYADERQLPWIGYKADWNNIDTPGAVIRFNRSGRPYNAIAGHMRNQLMADVGTHLCTFWDMKSTGTADMIDRALRKDIWVIIFDINKLGNNYHGEKPTGRTKQTLRTH